MLGFNLSATNSSKGFYSFEQCVCPFGFACLALIFTLTPKIMLQLLAVPAEPWMGSALPVFSTGIPLKGGIADNLSLVATQKGEG